MPQTAPVETMKLKMPILADPQVKMSNLTADPPRIKNCLISTKADFYVTTLSFKIKGNATSKRKERSDFNPKTRTCKI